MGVFDVFKPKDVDCKRIFGKTFCKVASTGAMTMIPTTTKYSVPLRFYTAKNCPETLCNVTYKNLVKMNAGLNNIFDIKVVEADKTRTPREVMMLPTILIGNQTIVGKDFDKVSLLEATGRHFNETPELQ